MKYDDKQDGNTYIIRKTVYELKQAQMSSKHIEETNLSHMKSIT